MRATTSRRTLVARGTTLALALPLVAATAALAVAADDPVEAPAGERVVLNHGHLDLATRLVDGGLKFSVKDGSVAGQKTWREPEDIVLHFDANHAFTVPDPEEIDGNPIFDVLGKPGDVLWKDGEGNDNSTTLWPGWSTETITAGELDGPVTVELTAVEGPGRFVHAQWADDPDWGVKFDLRYDTEDGLPDTVELAHNTHAHPLWFFDAEGVYRITLTMSATLASGAKVSDQDTLAVVVGDDVDPSTVEPGNGIPDATPSPTLTPTGTPTASPTATGSPTSPAPSDSPDPTGSASGSPNPSASASASDSASASTSASASASESVTATATATGSTSTSGGGSTGSGLDSLASTGAGVALPAGAAVAAVTLGGGALWLVRRKRAAR